MGWRYNKITGRGRGEGKKERKKNNRERFLHKVWTASTGGKGEMKGIVREQRKNRH